MFKKLTVLKYIFNLFKQNFFFKKGLILFLLSLNVNLNAYSQQDLRTAVIQPSPTSAVFNRYGVDQPSLSTGTVNIPISLFNIEAKGLSIPVTLTYQTSGITMFDNPYPSGYGWVFNPGFRITRVILGRKDEEFLFNPNPNSDYEIIKRGIIDEQLANYHQYSKSDLFDTQKDIFTLHMPDGSFNFFIKKAGTTLEVVSIGHQIRILPITGSTGLMGFEVTDANGVIYSFGYSDPSSILDYTEPAPFSGSTAWMLREVTLLNKEKITFSWQKVNTNAYSAKINAPINIRDRRDVDPFQDPYVEDVGGMIDCSTFSGANSLMLKTIELKNEIVDFTYKSSQDPFLQSILVKNKNNITVKTINFEYGTNPNNGSNRLLNSIEINGEKYKFIYNDKYFGETSTALDYWGFYNGKTSNLSLIPQMTIKVFTGIRPIPYDWWSSSPVTVGNADRSVSAENMQAYILTKIIYPTGGFTTYEYEPHQFAGMPHSHSENLFFQNPSPLTSGGGLRVTRIKNYSTPESTPEIKTFKYGNNEDGLANMQSAPTLETFIDEFGHAKEESYGVAGGYTWWTFRQMSINAISNYSKFIISKNPIWYSKVTEYINNDHKTEYSFSLHESYDVSWGLNFFAVYSPFVFRYGNLFNSGPELTNTIIYKKTGQKYLPVKKILNEYETIHEVDKDISSIIIDRKGIFQHLQLQGVDLYPLNNSFYPSNSYPLATSPLPGELDYNKLYYSIPVQYDRLKKSITTFLYDNANAINSFENYYYNEWGQISKISKGTSVSNKEVSIEYKYPRNFTEAPYPQMITRNMVSPIIEETISKNSFIAKKTKTNYADFTLSDLILPSSVQVQNGNNFMETRINFDSYDAIGNILQQHKSDDINEVYLWGYNAQYPVAKIVGSDYATVNSVVTQTQIDNAVNSGNDQTLRNLLNSLRTNSSTKDALITTYTYKPLIGITSMTDPKGYTSYYEYDDFGRLQDIKDADGNIIKTFEYNYKQ